MIVWSVTYLKDKIAVLKFSESLYLQAMHQETNITWKMDAFIHSGIVPEKLEQCVKKIYINMLNASSLVQ